MINPGVVAAIHVAGVRGDPCGAVQRTVARTAIFAVVGLNCEGMDKYRSDGREGIILTSL